ncbi:MAG: FHIPEP family type III secretion protein, partial [Bdellovibrionales bacterium]|nr:FHIPEP family type III secretion protein [Bdellovibrionales bacterium]
LLERVRSHLHRLITSRYAEDNCLRGWVLDPVVDLGFVKVEREQDALDPHQIQQLAEQYQACASTRPIICSPAARRLLKECLELRGVTTAVLAHTEISPDCTFKSEGTLGYVEQVQDSSTAEERYALSA